MLTRSGRNVPSVGGGAREVAFQVSTQLLTVMLGHVIKLEFLLNSLMTHATVITSGHVTRATAIQIDRQMVSHIYHLGHIFQIVSKALPVNRPRRDQL